MHKLYFKGKIKTGIGKYSELEFPNKTMLPEIPDDWPHQLYKGSLNICVDEDGYPEKFAKNCSTVGVKILDTIGFQPNFIIPGHLIKNNLLTPTNENPNRGDAQVWRANLAIDHQKESKDCWLVRRFCSGLKFDLEIVSDVHLRDHLNLEDKDNVLLCVFGTWAKANNEQL